MNNVHTSDLDPEPLRQFEAWFAQAGTDSVALATATPDGAPAARMVLLKGADDRGFTFFTNYESRKGTELAENPRAALLFHWKELGRQLRIEGDVLTVPPAESAEYFASRSPSSRLSALVSPQSRVIASREELERGVAELRERHGSGQLPAPAHWGGYRLQPRVYELWQRGEDRLHDRLRYRREPRRVDRARGGPASRDCVRGHWSLLGRGDQSCVRATSPSSPASLSRGSPASPATSPCGPTAKVARSSPTRRAPKAHMTARPEGKV